MKALFLDRDGVINKKIPEDYVKFPSEFVLLAGVQEALQILQDYFGLFFIVTNQQGIGKKLMTREQLQVVHKYMQEELDFTFDGIYYCPHLAEYRPFCRKPQPGMAYQALQGFPQIVFPDSVMVGDMGSDMQFARAMEMKAVQITDGEKSQYADEQYDSLLAYANALKT